MEKTKKIQSYTLTPPHKMMRVTFTNGHILPDITTVRYDYMKKDSTGGLGGVGEFTIHTTASDGLPIRVSLKHGETKSMGSQIARNVWNSLLEIGWKREVAE